MFALVTWGLWWCHNKTIWENEASDPYRTPVWIAGMWQELRKLKPVCTARRVRPKAQWEAPPMGRLKLNADGAFCLEFNCGNAGFVVRDELGYCKAASSRSITFVQSALHSEAEALRDGLLVSIYQGWNNLVVESDNLTLVQSVLRDDVDLSGVSCIIEDCKRYMKCFGQIQVRHFFREANGVAHRLPSLWTWRIDSWA